MGKYRDKEMKLFMVQIHPKTHIGHVEFKVKDLERQIAFYENVVGLEVIKQEGIKHIYLKRWKERVTCS